MTQEHADPLALLRIVSNLVANAVRYTSEGRVLVGCRRNGKRLRFVVADTGPGFPAADLEALQQPYRQAAADSPGHGLVVISQ